MMTAWNGRGGSGSPAAMTHRRSVECVSEVKWAWGEGRKGDVVRVAHSAEDKLAVVCSA
jgi:hypothetical protein